MVSSDSRIIIVGGGVFGLSTALWLARSGYKNITVFDRCAFDKNFYDPSNGCDGASADINKIFRIAYGDHKEYQDLAIEARELWLSWSKSVQNADPSKLPAGIDKGDQLFYNSGCIFLGEGSTFTDYYAQSLATMEKTAPEFRKMQFVKDNTQDEKRLKDIDPRWVEKFHIIDKVNSGNTHGFLDINSGITIADKSCVYARFLCEQAGVKFVLGTPEGRLDTLIVEQRGLKKKVMGIQTCDGKSHYGDLVVVACGSWTASVIPEACHTVEATAGTLVFIDIPKERQDLRDKFHPDNYPVWSYRGGQGDEYHEGGSFPITKEGRLKFGFRGRKFTNFKDHPTSPNIRISTPRTKYSDDPIKSVPLHGLRSIKKIISQALPELTEFDFTDSRLCWYTDSIDNDYVIDYVPGYDDTLFICTGGSGHAFKFLPILGRHVKNQIENKLDEFSPLWKWRVAKEGESNNGLSEGEGGSREMSKLQFAAPSDFAFSNEADKMSKLRL